jgi:hypothetical protein
MYFNLVLMAISMFLITFTMGYMPKFFSNRSFLQLFSVFGAGTLLGISFMIILPESIKVIIDASLIQTGGTLAKSTGIHIGLALTAGFILMILIEELI